MAGFKFRVTYRAQEEGKKQLRTVEFRYRSYARAKTDYKAILLEFYRKRYPVSYKVCLNRACDAPWENPIFQDWN